MQTEGQKCCSCPALIITSGSIFAIIAIVHLMRVVCGWSVTFDGSEVPSWASWITILISGGMAGWSFCNACCKKCCRKNPPESPIK